MKEYSSYTTTDFLNDDLFLFWFYSREGDYYRKIIAEYPDREPYLKEAMERLATLKWEKASLPQKEVDDACLRLEQAIQTRKMSQRKHKLYKIGWLSASAAAAILILFVSLEVIWKTAPAVDYLASLQVSDSVLTSSKIQLFVNEQLKETFESDPDLNYNQMATDVTEGVLNKLVVSYGKRAHVTLCDGTKIWANAGTVLLFPTRFEDKKREIYVDGEIYIDVTPNPEKPFIVKTSDMGIKVLGTSFYVSAYRKDAEKSIVLVTGKVEVAASNGETVRILPNDRFRQSADRYVVDKVNVEDYGSWKDGQLSFRNTELSVILNQLSRYYNVRIVYDKQQRITCSGKLDLDDTIEQLLNTITETAPVVISKENDTYKVTPKKSSL